VTEEIPYVFEAVLTSLEAKSESSSLCQLDLGGSTYLAYLINSKPTGILFSLSLNMSLLTLSRFDKSINLPVKNPQ